MPRFRNTKPSDVGEIVSLLIHFRRPLAANIGVAFYHQLTGFSISFSILDDKERETLNELVAQQSQTS